MTGIIGARAIGAAAMWLALLAPPAPAWAQATTERPGRILPQSATSTCLGDLRSPTCAAETLLACFARGDGELCRRANAPNARTSGPREPILLEYVIERTSIIRREDITEDLQNVDWFKPGFALVEVLHRSCPAAASDCKSESWVDLQIYARPRGSAAWEIVTWRSEGEADTPGEIPDAFRQPQAR